MRPLTLSDLPSLNYGTTLHHATVKNSDGTPLRIRVNGKVRTWKRNPQRIEIPCKQGLYNHHTVSYDEIVNGRWMIEA